MAFSSGSGFGLGGAIRWLSLLAALLVSGSSFATGGYFSYGYGTKAKGMSGAAVATTDDAYGGSVNPAKMAFVGNRFENDAEIFMPRRKIQRTGSTLAGGIYNDGVTSRNGGHFIPALGFNRDIDERLSLGLTIYGNGGLNTEYNDDNGVPGSNLNPAVCGKLPANFFLGCGRVGVDLTQIIVAPTVAWKFRPRHAFGIAPLITYQRIKIDGLQAFAPLSRKPNKVSDHGSDNAFGLGVRFGYLGRVTDSLTLAAAYATKVYMGDFKEYRGLFADESFDIPSNFSLGFEYLLTRRLSVAGEWQRINFAAVPALGNGILNSIVSPTTAPLGARNGSGFNWRNQDNYKLGFQFAASPRITWRWGAAWGRSPARNGLNDTSFSLLAPGLGEWDWSVGMTWTTRGGNELSLAYHWAPAKHIKGPSATPAGGTDKLRAEVTSFAFGYAWR